MPFVSPFSKVTCPFCFGQFHLSAAPTRVISATGETMPDNVLANFFGPTFPVPELGPVEEPSRGLLTRAWRRFFLPATLETGNPIHRRICPHCHLPLPKATANGEMASDIVGIVGSRSVGKSNFFGVLIEQLEGRFADEVGFALWDQETYSVNAGRVRSNQLFTERYGSLFRSSGAEAVPPSPSALTNFDIRMPLIYRLSFPLRPLDYVLRPRAQLRATDLVIFDAAGENLNDLTAQEHFWRYAIHSTAIVFLIDPFGYPAIRNRLPSDLRDRLRDEQEQVGAKPADSVNAVLNSFTASGQLPTGRKIPVPAAFALTKCDLLKDILPADSLILKDPKHEGGFNLGECMQVSQEIVAFLREHQCTDLIAKAENAFTHHCFFGVSALGCLPGTDYRIPALRPSRVADPLLWILHQQGHLRAMRDGS